MTPRNSQPLEALPPPLLDRARRAARAEVGALAMHLFLDQGFDETTVEEICARAGLSRSTFFRYFPTKEDVVLESSSTHGQQIADSLKQRPGDETAWAALRGAFETQAQLISENRDWFVRLARLAAQTASVRARRQERTLVWRELLVPEVARRLGLATPPAGDPRPAALVAAAIGCFEAATDAWTESDGAESLPALLHLAMDAVTDSPLDAGTSPNR